MEVSTNKVVLRHPASTTLVHPCTAPPQAISHNEVRSSITYPNTKSHWIPARKICRNDRENHLQPNEPERKCKRAFIPRLANIYIQKKRSYCADNSFTLMAIDIVTTSGLIIFVPLVTTIREPRVAPIAWPTSMTPPIIQNTLPPMAKKMSEAILVEKLRTYA